MSARKPRLPGVRLPGVRRMPPPDPPDFIKGLPVGVVARFGAGAGPNYFGIDELVDRIPASELRVGPRGGLKLHYLGTNTAEGYVVIGGWVKPAGGEYVSRYTWGILGDLSHVLDRIEWIHPTLLEKIAPRLSDEQYKLLCHLDPHARRRRLRELHPDKLGRDHTAAERAEYTRLTRK